MIRILAGFFLLFAIRPLATTYAQEDVYNWGDYPFALTLPDGWVAVENGDSLIIGSPDDTERVMAGQSVTGLALVAHIVPSPPGDSSRSIEDYWLSDFLSAGRNDILDVEPKSYSYGAQIWTMADIPDAGAGLRGRMTLVAQTYLITAVAPVEQWDEFVPTLDAIIASITAEPIPEIRPPALTQRFTWRGLSFSTPESWIIASAGGSYEVIATTHIDRLIAAQTFRFTHLQISIRDLSYARPLLGAESLRTMRALAYNPEDAVGSDIVELSIDSVAAYSLDINPAGQAVLLLTPDHAFLMVGISDLETWLPSEKALFEAMLATVSINETGD
jgi:hypothetical protein